MLNSGVIIDFYDDSRGELFRELFSGPEAIPPQVKTAHALTVEERDRLPDDVFALVLVTPEGSLRKYACTDLGNTALSVRYFQENGHKLPEEAQKVAAQNLKTACTWYGIEPPPLLEKVAIGMMTALTLPLVAQGVHGEVKQRNEVAREAGGNVVTPHEMHAALGRIKEGELSMTSIMPGETADKSAPSTGKTVIKKVAGGIAHLVKGHGGEHGDTVPDNEAMSLEKKEQKKALPQMHSMTPHVDMTGVSVTHVAKLKQASQYALGEKYPLDGYDQIQAAARYFDDHGQRFTPAERHEYCQHLVKRAEDVGIPLSDSIRRYGGHTFAEPGELKFAFDSRRALLPERAHHRLLDELEKFAGLVSRLATDGTAHPVLDPVLSPYGLLGALEEFDKVAGLDFYYDQDLMDPYFSVLGIEKRADEDYNFILGNDVVYGPELCQLAETRSMLIKKMFGEDFAKEFRKDPTGIFSSLPVEQKKIIMRMAGEPSSGTQEL